MSNIISLEEVLASSVFIGTHRLDSTRKTYCNACMCEMLYVGGLTVSAKAPCAGFALPATLIVSRDAIMMCIASSVDGTGDAITCNNTMSPIESRSKEWTAGRELFNSFA